MNEEPPKSPVSDQQNAKMSDEENLSKAATLSDGESPEKKSEAENSTQGEPAKRPSKLRKKPNLETTEENTTEKKDGGKAAVEPPVDWFEPLEEDDDASDGGNDPEEESLAGESERSEGVTGAEKPTRRSYQVHTTRRKRTHPDEGWVEWSILGEGWKRKEVVRRSGSSIGQKDVYYIGPRGDRVRSRVELVTILAGTIDLTNFDYKSGKFFGDGEVPPVRVRHRAKRKFRERSSSESSMMDRGEGADTPDSHHRLTPSVVQKNLHSTSNQTVSSQGKTITTPERVMKKENPRESSRESSRENSRETSRENSRENLRENLRENTRENLRENAQAVEKIRLPPPSLLSKPPLLPSINGAVGTEDSTLICSRCGISFTGTWYDKQRKRPSCPACWSSKTKEHPLIRFRKWIPCGQCVGCHNTVNCGQCANCKHGLQSPDSRKRPCRKRRCICPIRKAPGGGGVSYMPQKTYSEPPEPAFDDSVSVQSEVTDSQQQSLKSSDTENFSVNVDVDEDDMSTDDDDDWHKKRKRRSCGECKACLCRKDCGTCDFCIDKPKFGGSNKKRQKCRLRQCQRQAMRHLLPSQMGQGEFGPEGSSLPGRPRPQYTYSRKPGYKKNKSQFNYDMSDEDEDSSYQSMSWSSEPASGSRPYEVNLKTSSSMQLKISDMVHRNGLSDKITHISNHNSRPVSINTWGTERPSAGRQGPKHVEEEYDDDDDDDDDDEEEDLPMITQIFSLAENTVEASGNVENRLMKLLNSLRSSALPILWHAIMVEGPQLQLIQCSKQSSMADTIILIDPDFCYQVTVQKQPLLPTHPLYDSFPPHLSSVTEVVNLLLGLEQYVVCRGLPYQEPLSNKDILIVERASTCDFLVRKNMNICANCKALQGL